MTITSLQTSLQNNSISLLELSDGGLKKEKLDACDQQPLMKDLENECITSKMSNNSLESAIHQQSPKKPFVTPVSAPTIKKKTLKDKLTSSKPTTQMQRLSKTSALDSTGIDKDLKPFWNEYTLELSKKLWLPTKTDCVDLDMSSLNGSSERLMLNSWFSAQTMTSKTSLENSQKTCLQSPPFSLLKTTDLEHQPTKKKGSDKLQAERAWKIKLYPTTLQKKTIQEWLGVRRWIYNRALNEIQTNGCKPTLKELRRRVVNNENFLYQNTWMLDYEYDLRDEALQDLLKNYRSNFAKGNKFKVQFLKLKDQTSRNVSLSVLSKKWNKRNNFYSSVFRPDKLKSSEPLPEVLDYTSRLIRTPTREYYLSIPKPMVKRCENQAPKESRIISIDPGVKNFLTGYDPSGNVYTWGKNDIGRIARLLHYRGKLQSKIDTSTKHRRRYKLRIALLRINKKIFDLVDILHKHTSKWLCENFTTVLIPKLNFHNCRKLAKRHKQKMMSLRHCSFVDYLKEKSKEFPWCRVIETTEAWTSKTCGCCGMINDKLGMSRDFLCKQCNIEMDRDVNASRNVLLRHMTLEITSSS